MSTDRLPHADDILAAEIESVLCPNCNGGTVTFHEVELGVLKTLSGHPDCDGEEKIIEERLWRVDARCDSCAWVGKITKARGGKATLEDWIDYLLATWPNEYKDRKPPEKRTPSVPGPGKIFILEQRLASGYGLWHSNDQDLILSRPGDRGRNGRERKGTTKLIADRNPTQQTSKEKMIEQKLSDLISPKPMMIALAGHGLDVGRRGLSPCPDCGWRHRRQHFPRLAGLRVSWCSWCGLELADETTEGKAT